jgi:undecaprenyl-diphosphatase
MKRNFNINKFQQILFILAIVAFVSLYHGVTANRPWIHQLDTFIINHVRGSFPSWKTAILTKYTVLFNPTPTAIWMIIGTILLALRRKVRAAFFFALTPAFGSYANHFIKQIVDRPRPTTHLLMHYGGYSFPSGHSIGAMLVLGGLIILSQYYLQSKNWRYFINTLLTLLIILVGYSRIYVGVHYPTDVLAGFSLGLIILIISETLFGLHRRSRS